LERATGKVLIGMNQIDLWSGGQQMNRASNYLYNSEKHNSENVKLLCVICNLIQFKTPTKVFSLFETGFSNNTLCYLGGLKNIIYEYFGIENIHNTIHQ